MSLSFLKFILRWHAALPPAAKTILSLFVMITAPAIFIIATEIRNPKVATNAEFEQTILSKIDDYHRQIDDFQHQITDFRVFSAKEFASYHRSIDSLAKSHSAMNAAIRDLSIVIFANGPDEMFRRIAPSLDRIEDNTYRAIVHLQKQEILKRIDSLSIQARKLKTPHP